MVTPQVLTDSYLIPREDDVSVHKLVLLSSGVRQGVHQVIHWHFKVWLSRERTANSVFECCISDLLYSVSCSASLVLISSISLLGVKEIYLQLFSFLMKHVITFRYSLQTSWIEAVTSWAGSSRPLSIMLCNSLVCEKSVLICFRNQSFSLVFSSSSDRNIEGAPSQSY